MKVLSEDEVKTELNKIKGDGKNDILLDAEDTKIIIENKDLLLIGTCENSSDNAASKVIKSIIDDFENNRPSLIKLDGILVYFQVHSKYDITKLCDAMEIINNKYENHSIFHKIYTIFGMYCDDSLDIDYSKATVFFGLSKKENYTPSNNIIEKSLL